MKVSKENMYNLLDNDGEKNMTVIDTHEWTADEEEGQELYGVRYTIRANGKMWSYTVYHSSEWMWCSMDDEPEMITLAEVKE